MKYLTGLITKHFIKCKTKRKPGITIKITTPGCTYESLELEEVQKEVEEKYFPDLKRKVKLVYTPEYIFPWMATNNKIVGYKPRVEIGPMGVVSLAYTLKEVKEGVLAHEYAHVYLINKKFPWGAIKRAWTKIYYKNWDDFDKRVKYEMKTDLEAVKRGAGIQMKASLEAIKEFYLLNPNEDLERLIEELDKRIENVQKNLNKQ